MAANHKRWKYAWYSHGKRESGGLAPGTYTGTIALSSDGAGNTPLLIPVTLMVSTSTVLTAAPASVQFVAQQGGTAPASQTVHLDSGGTPIAVTYQGSPGTDWLTFTGGPNAPGDLAISVSPTGLAPGRYTGVILVVSTFAVNSPLEIPVTFDVNATPVLSTLPSILQFAYSISGTSPMPQAFSVGASSGPPLALQHYRGYFAAVAICVGNWNDAGNGLG